MTYTEFSQDIWCHGPTSNQHTARLTSYLTFLKSLPQAKDDTEPFTNCFFPKKKKEAFLSLIHREIEVWWQSSDLAKVTQTNLIQINQITEAGLNKLLDNLNTYMPKINQKTQQALTTGDGTSRRNLSVCHCNSQWVTSVSMISQIKNSWGTFLIMH